LRITSQQIDFCGSIAPHLLATKVLEQSVKDADSEEEDEDEEDGVLLEREGTSVGTAAITPSPKPKNKMTIEIGGEPFNNPIVYRANNNKDQILLRVPNITTEQSFERSKQPTKFLENLRETDDTRNANLPGHRGLCTSIQSSMRQNLQRVLKSQKLRSTEAPPGNARLRLPYCPLWHSNRSRLFKA
jgi:hypothetical protein